MPRKPAEIDQNYFNGIIKTEGPIDYEILERLTKALETNPSLRTNDNIKKFHDKVSDQIELTLGPKGRKLSKRDSQREDQYNILLEALDNLQPQTSRSQRKQSASDAKDIVPMFGLVVSYRDHLKFPLPHDHPSCQGHGAVRAHIFPVRAFIAAAKRCSDEIEGEAVKKKAILGGISQEPYHHDTNTVANLIPCVILPKSLELWMDGLITEYAIHISDTGRTSANYPQKKAKDSATAAITNASEFASQFPDAYLEIFCFLLKEEARLTDSEIATVKLSLREGVNRLRELSEECFPGNLGLFGTDKTNLPRTRSHEEFLQSKDGIVEYRQVGNNATSPSLDEFKNFLAKRVERADSSGKDSITSAASSASGDSTLRRSNHSLNRSSSSLSSASEIFEDRNTPSPFKPIKIEGSGDRDSGLKEEEETTREEDQASIGSSASSAGLSARQPRGSKVLGEHKYVSKSDT